MHRRTAIAAGAAALAGCSNAIFDPSARDAEQLIRKRINDQRVGAGVAEVDGAERLRKVAREHSQDMAQRDFYAHENPDGLMPSDRASCAAGEIIHRGQVGEMKNIDSSKTWYTTDAEGIAGYIVEGWVLSDEHYELMTGSRWSSVGVGLEITDEGELFATAVFC